MLVHLNFGIVGVKYFACRSSAALLTVDSWLVSYSSCKASVSVTIPRSFISTSLSPQRNALLKIEDHFQLGEEIDT